LADGAYTVQADVINTAGLAAHASQAITVDETPPTVAVAGSLTVKADQADTITFTFSEPVTGFDNTSVSVTGGTLGPITKVNGSTYPAAFTPTANFEGTGSVQVVASGWTDTAGNPGTASNTVLITEDTKAPTVVVAADLSALKANQPDPIMFTFSEPVTGFDNTSVSVTGGTLTTITKEDSRHHIAAITPTTSDDTHTSTNQ